MPKPYTVALISAHALTLKERIAAEIRYIIELERVLDGPDAVWPSWLDDQQRSGEWNSTTGPDSPPVPKTSWAMATQVATAAGWGDLAQPQGAYFKVEMAGEAHGVESR